MTWLFLHQSGANHQFAVQRHKNHYTMQQVVVLARKVTPTPHLQVQNSDTWSSGYGILSSCAEPNSDTTEQLIVPSPASPERTLQSLGATRDVQPGEYTRPSGPHAMGHEWNAQTQVDSGRSPVGASLTANMIY